MGLNYDREFLWRGMPPATRFGHHGSAASSVSSGSTHSSSASASNLYASGGSFGGLGELSSDQRMRGNAASAASNANAAAAMHADASAYCASVDRLIKRSPAVPATGAAPAPPNWQEYSASYAPLATPNENYAGMANLGSATSGTATGDAALHDLEWFNAGRNSESALGASANPSGFSDAAMPPRHSSPGALFGVEPLASEYEPSSYSLWNNGAAPGGTSSMAESTTPVYLADEDLKMSDYPALSELNQGDLEYFVYGSMDPSAASGATGASASGAGSTSYRDQQVDRMFANNEPMRVKSEHLQGGASKHSSSNPTAAASHIPARGMATGFRGLSRNIMIDTSVKRPVVNISAGMTAGDAGLSPNLSGDASMESLTPLGSRAKRPRSRQCDFPDCTNRARSHQKCKKHGGAHQCVYEGCTKNSQSRGLCIAHGGGSRCKVEGCTRASQSKGLCKSHGGGEYCAVDGCRKKAHLKHLCRTHGGGVRCKSPKCIKWAQRKGWCMAHAKEMLGP